MIQKLIKFEQAVSMVLLSAIVICVFAAAIMRTFGLPIIWSVDIAQLMFVWLCMISANQTLRKGEHVGIDYFVRRLSVQAQIYLDIILFSIVSIFLAVLVYYGVVLTLLNPERILGTIELSYSWVTAAIPCGALLLLITTLAQTFYLIQIVNGRKPLDASVDFLQRYIPEESQA